MNIRMSPKNAGRKNGGFIRKRTEFFQNLSAPLRSEG